MFLPCTACMSRALLSAPCENSNGTTAVTFGALSFWAVARSQISRVTPLFLCLLVLFPLTRATIEVSTMFFLRFPQFWELLPMAKTFMGKNKTATERKIHGLGSRRKPHAKPMTYFRRFWIDNPRHSEAISDEKCYLRRSAPRFARRITICTKNPRWNG